MSVRLRRAGHFLERVVDRLSRVYNAVGVGTLAVLMCFTTVDVCLRYFFNRPLTGSVELTEFMLVILVSCGIAYTQLYKGHVNIELIVSRLPQRAQAVTNIITGAASLGLFSLITWQCIVQAKSLQSIGLTTQSLFIPVFPFMLVLALGSGLLCLVLLVELRESVSQAVKKWSR